MRINFTKGAALIFFGILIVAACTTLNKNLKSKQAQSSVDTSRAPASFCEPTDEDTLNISKILAKPSEYQVVRKKLERQQVQIYMMDAELIHDFDEMLQDPKIPMEQIYSSHVYMK